MNVGRMENTCSGEAATGMLFCLAVLIFFLAAGPAQSVPAGQGAAGEGSSPAEIIWSSPQPGLELGLASMAPAEAGEEDAYCVFVRLSPRLVTFSLHMASETGAAHSLRQWAELEGLVAGINASMYLPDNSTSTGLMRTRGHVNNGRAGKRLGAFFVSLPEGPGLPAADILEHDGGDWEKRLSRYGLAVQNYRLLNSRGRILWPEGGPAHSIAAVGKDRRGRILFILAQRPLPAADFAGLLKKFPLDLGPVMYVEGGSQAGLFVRETGTQAVPARPGAASFTARDGVIHVWKGRHSLLDLRGNPEAPLPNIIGVRAAGGQAGRP
ncbi:MAG: phosphodiester glycosidase family protein [Desulfovibrio sp.]|jgi:hypothetical protein|nr:phosphodiester glycosidase family protein [Desulfovibrio sp.]